MGLKPFITFHVEGSNGELAVAVRITFDRWRHMFEAEVVMEASVDVVITRHSLV